MCTIPVKGLPKTWSRIPVTQAKGMTKVLCAFRARKSHPDFLLMLPVHASQPFIAFHIFCAFPACYTAFLALYMKDAIVSIILLYA